MPSQVKVNAKQEDTFQELLCVCVFALVESFMSKRLSTCSVSRGTLLEPVTQWSESWTTFYTALLSDDLVCLRVAVRTDQCKNCVCACVF